MGGSCMAEWLKKIPDVTEKWHQAIKWCVQTFDVSNLALLVYVINKRKYSI